MAVMTVFKYETLIEAMCKTDAVNVSAIQQLKARLSLLEAAGWKFTYNVFMVQAQHTSGANVQDNMPCMMTRILSGAATTSERSAFRARFTEFVNSVTVTHQALPAAEATAENAEALAHPGGGDALAGMPPPAPQSIAVPKVVPVALTKLSISVGNALLKLADYASSLEPDATVLDSVIAAAEKAHPNWTPSEPGEVDPRFGEVVAGMQPFLNDWLSELDGPQTFPLVGGTFPNFKFIVSHPMVYDLLTAKGRMPGKYVWYQTPAKMAETWAAQQTHGIQTLFDTKGLKATFCVSCPAFPHIEIAASTKTAVAVLAKEINTPVVTEIKAVSKEEVEALQLAKKEKADALDALQSLSSTAANVARLGAAAALLLKGLDPVHSVHFNVSSTPLFTTLNPAVKEVLNLAKIGCEVVDSIDGFDTVSMEFPLAFQETCHTLAVAALKDRHVPVHGLTTKATPTKVMFQVDRMDQFMALWDLGVSSDCITLRHEGPVSSHLCARVAATLLRRGLPVENAFTLEEIPGKQFALRHKIITYSEVAAKVLIEEGYTTFAPVEYVIKPVITAEDCAVIDADYPAFNTLLYMHADILALLRDTPCAWEGISLTMHSAAPATAHTTNLSSKGLAELISTGLYSVVDSLGPALAPPKSAPAPAAAKPPTAGLGAKATNTKLVVALKDAVALGDPVKGSSAGAVYYVVAMRPDLKVAARESVNGVSIRVEGEALPTITGAMASMGGANYPSYSSIHVEKNANCPAPRIIGAVLFSLGVEFNSVIQGGNNQWLPAK